MYRDGPSKNHRFCYYGSWAWVSRTPEGSLTWEAGLDHTQMAARTFVQAMQANRSSLNQHGLTGLLSLWSPLQPWHSRSYCSEARRTLRDEAKEMPRVFFVGKRQNQPKPPTYIRAFSGHRMGSGGSHRPLSVPSGGEF